MSNTKISIIIPVYNVQQFLKRCLDSVLAQSFEDFEVILVDDKSSDLSSKICDEYQNHDQRVKVIHKTNNCGLSAARNTGIELSIADYITFVDSDDWISENYLQELYASSLEEDADITISNFEKKYDSNRDGKVRYKSNVSYISTDQILLALFQGKIGTSAWGKLYKKVLFSDIKFPRGSIYEDIGTTYRVFSKCKKVTLSIESTYYYYQRTGSIVNSNFNDQDLDIVKLVNEIQLFIINNFPQLKEAAECYSAKSILSIIDRKYNKNSLRDSLVAKKLKNELHKYNESISHISYYESNFLKLRYNVFLKYPRLYLLMLYIAKKFGYI